jgi:hypothetical protein
METGKGQEKHTHSLAGGGAHNLSYYAFLWYEVLHGDMDPFGHYPYAQILPDKIAGFLYEFHDSEFRTLGLPPLPDDRSQTNIHGMLDVVEVTRDVNHYVAVCINLNKLKEICKTCIIMNKF